MKAIKVGSPRRSRRTLQAGVVPQGGNMGCGVACVASLTGLSYSDSRLLFAGRPGDDHHRGYSRKSVILALAKARLRYEFRRKVPNVPVGTIVYLKDATWPKGHYLVRQSRGWMDPFHERITSRLPGIPRSYVVPA